MIFKSYLIEQNPEFFDKHNIFLFYGENHGLKREFRKILKSKNIKNEKLNFLQEEIIQNESILLNEISNKSLFNEKKIIFIDLVSEKFSKVIDEIISNVVDEKVLLFAENLDKKSKLRHKLEKSKTCAVIPCYPDNEITIKKIILDKLKQYKGLTPQVINFIVQNTGLDRNKVNNEIDKIKSCFIDKIIEPEKLVALLNIRMNDDFNKLRDEAINGNKINTNKLLGDTIFESENNIFYLNLINQRINKLNEIENMKKNEENVEFLISKLRPPIFWKDKPIIIEQSKKWDRNKLKKALKKTYEIELKIKSSPAIKKDLLIKNLIIDLCSTANSA